MGFCLISSRSAIDLVTLYRSRVENPGAFSVRVHVSSGLLMLRSSHGILNYSSQYLLCSRFSVLLSWGHLIFFFLLTSERVDIWRTEHVHIYTLVGSEVARCNDFSYEKFLGRKQFRMPLKERPDLTTRCCLDETGSLGDTACLSGWFPRLGMNYGVHTLSCILL